MDSGKILYSKGQNDECYTPDYGVAPIIPYIPQGATVWCPFDTEESQYVKLIRAAGHRVIASHIWHGQDFMTWEPGEHWDCIVSNPPFGRKRQTFERALSFNKPFALIMNMAWLLDAAPAQIFAEKDLQLMKFDKRIDFQGTGDITFSSGYWCWNFLPKQIVMARLDKPKRRNLKPK